MVVHGLQFKEKDKEQWPTTYYGHSTGIGIVFNFLRSQHHPLNVAIIGLGSGTVATYGKKGDNFSFYEIDPDVMTVANTLFTFLSKSQATIKTILGDARIRLQQQLASEGSKQYDLIIIDAFNGDAIPTHLLTKEALALYEKHLAKNGIIVLHTSNTYLNFQGVTKALANVQGCTDYWLANDKDEKIKVFASTWAIVTCNPNFGLWLKEKRIPVVNMDNVEPRLWTDDFNTILPLLKWSG